MNDEQPIYPWTVQKTSRAFSCRVFDVEKRRSSEQSPAGIPAKVGDFYVIRPPDWVNVVALTDRDEVVMIEQWRHGIDRVTLEIPGGMVDDGEPSLAAAQRELREETGFTSQDWLRVGTVEPNPAIQSNACHTFVARNAAQTETVHFDEHERIRACRIPYLDVLRRVANGEITHSLVVAGLMHEHLRRTRPFESQNQALPRPARRG